MTSASLIKQGVWALDLCPGTGISENARLRASATRRLMRMSALINKIQTCGNPRFLLNPCKTSQYFDQAEPSATDMFRVFNSGLGWQGLRSQPLAVVSTGFRAK